MGDPRQLAQVRALSLRVTFLSGKAAHHVPCQSPFESHGTGFVDLGRLLAGRTFSARRSFYRFHGGPALGSIPR